MIGLTLLCGCQPAGPGTTTVAQSPAGQQDVHVSSGGVSQDQTASPDQILGDPDEMRLGDIGEALLMYYSVNKAMPAQLTDVQSATNEQLNFDSPSSGKPYGYAPAGLVAGNGAKRIFVYDSAPGRDGKRWCWEGPVPTGGPTLVMEMVEMPEAAFKLYSPAAP